MEHHKHYTPKMILKRDKISFVFTKLPWEPILDRYCSIEIPILYFLLSFWSWASNKPFQICFGEFSTVQGECKYNTVYFSVVQTVPKIQAVKCCLLRCKSSCTSCTYIKHLSGMGVLASVRRTYSRNVTRDHVYNQNGYDTRSRDRRSTLVDK